MNDHRLMARLRVHPSILREIFQLPAGATVIRVGTAPEMHGVLDIVVSGAGWETLEGEEIRVAIGTIAREDTGLQIDWGFPK